MNIKKNILSFIMIMGIMMPHRVNADNNYKNMIKSIAPIILLVISTAWYIYNVVENNNREC